MFHLFLSSIFCGLLVADFDQALTGQEVTTKREWLLRGSSELFNPKDKTVWQTQIGIPFQKSPRCCLFLCCVYLTLFTVCPKAARGASMWSAAFKGGENSQGWICNSQKSSTHSEFNQTKLAVNPAFESSLRTLPSHCKLAGLWILQCNKTTTSRSLWGWKWTQR